MNKYHVYENNTIYDDELQNNIGREYCRTCKDCIFIGQNKITGKPAYDASFCEAFANKPYEVYFENKDACEYKETEEK